MERQGPVQTGIIFLAAVILIGTACCVRFSPYSAINRYKNISVPTEKAYAMGAINNSDITDEAHTTEEETTVSQEETATKAEPATDKPSDRVKTTAVEKKTTKKFIPPKTTAKTTQAETEKTSVKPTEPDPPKTTESDTKQTTARKSKIFS